MAARPDDHDELDDRIRRALDRQLDTTTRRVIETWSHTWDRISSELQAASDAIAEARAAGTLTASQAARLDSVRGAKDATRAAIIDALSDISDTLVAGIGASVNLGQSSTLTQIGSQLPARPGILAALGRASREQVRQIVHATVRRTDTYLEELGASVLDSIHSELIRGVSVGSNPRDVARRIMGRVQGRFAGGLGRAMTTARTVMLDANRDAARATELANRAVLQEWEWSADLSPDTCRACFAMHGRRFPLEQPGPEGHPNCRCARKVVTKSWEELGFHGIEEPPPLTPDADKFFDGLSEAEQRRILGNAGFEQWKAGNFNRNEWAAYAPNSAWRGSWTAAPVPREPDMDVLENHRVIPRHRIHQ